MDQESLRLLDDLNEGDRIEVRFGGLPTDREEGTFGGLIKIGSKWRVCFQQPRPCAIQTYLIRSIKRLSRARK